MLSLSRSFYVTACKRNGAISCFLSIINKIMNEYFSFYISFFLETEKICKIYSKFVFYVVKRLDFNAVVALAPLCLEVCETFAVKTFVFKQAPFMFCASSVQILFCYQHVIVAPVLSHGLLSVLQESVS